MLGRFKGIHIFHIFQIFLKCVFLQPNLTGHSFHYKDFINNILPVLYKWDIWLETFP